MKFPRLSFVLTLAVVSASAHGDADPTALAAELLVGSVSVKPGATSGESWVVLGFQEAKADGNRQVA